MRACIILLYSVITWLQMVHEGRRFKMTSLQHKCALSTELQSDLKQETPINCSDTSAKLVYYNLQPLISHIFAPTFPLS